eukprot:TRINITY_DN4714_c3_g1_i1.p1 TRINITY_DN4714_c3_g1~~TRINITY_DN4714_c3_g1_i1.p1  ORF type:complete len:511 (+),score=104.84 TRINITY_DN4714_c3_g1_i1:70-1602(+)
MQPQQRGHWSAVVKCYPFETGDRCALRYSAEGTCLATVQDVLIDSFDPVPKGYLQLVCEVPSTKHGSQESGQKWAEPIFAAITGQVSVQLELSQLNTRLRPISVLEASAKFLDRFPRIEQFLDLPEPKAIAVSSDENGGGASRAWAVGFCSPQHPDIRTPADAERVAVGRCRKRSSNEAEPVDLWWRPVWGPDEHLDVPQGAIRRTWAHGEWLSDMEVHLPPTLLRRRGTFIATQAELRDRAAQLLPSNGRDPPPSPPGQQAAFVTRDPRADDGLKAGVWVQVQTVRLSPFLTGRVGRVVQQDKGKWLVQILDYPPRRQHQVLLKDSLLRPITEKEARVLHKRLLEETPAPRARKEPAADGKRDGQKQGLRVGAQPFMSQQRRNKGQDDKGDGDTGFFNRTGQTGEDQLAKAEAAFTQRGRKGKWSSAEQVEGDEAGEGEGSGGSRRDDMLQWAAQAAETKRKSAQRRQEGITYRAASSLLKPERCKGPFDTAKPFDAGRGRPIRVSSDK